jgi:hypothetical protein
MNRLSNIIGRRALEELLYTLLDTEYGVEAGLNLIGIDPDRYDHQEIEAITNDLAKLGLIFDRAKDRWRLE